MHSSALIAPFFLAAGANGFAWGPTRLSGVGVVLGGAGQQQQQSLGRRGGTAIAMSSTVPPQLPDMNQNLSGGDFDK